MPVQQYAFKRAANTLKQLVSQLIPNYGCQSKRSQSKTATDTVQNSPKQKQTYKQGFLYIGVKVNSGIKCLANNDG